MSGCLLLFIQPRFEDIKGFNSWQARAQNGLPGVTKRLALSVKGGKDETNHYRYLYLYEIAQLDLLSNHAIEQILQSGADCILRSNWQIYKTLKPARNSNIQARYVEPPPVIVTVGMTVSQNPDTLAQLDAWYTEEHIPRMSTVPGWRAVTRYSLLKASDDTTRPPTAPLLAVHEWELENGLGGEAWKTAVFTPWTKRISAMQTAPMQRVVWHSAE